LIGYEVVYQAARYVPLIQILSPVAQVKGVLEVMPTAWAYDVAVLIQSITIVVVVLGRANP
jgi:hypothetical protein